MDTKDTAVVVPQINLNGTSTEELMAGCQRAWEKVQGALDALCEIRPHGRDYQTAAPGLYERARAQHEARMRSLETVKDEIYEVWEGVQKQAEERRRARS